MDSYMSILFQIKILNISIVSIMLNINQLIILENLYTFLYLININNLIYIKNRFCVFVSNNHKYI